jgi:prepilin-type N-terminal cleavage/methylation domain-containing protein
MNKRNGFTLIELLVVVAIIGLLAAVGTVAYTGYTSSAKLRVASANLKQISSWLGGEAYKVCQSKQGRNKNGMYSNIGDKNGNDKAEWMNIAAPSNY